MPYTEVKSETEFNRIIQGSGSNLVVVDFFAVWCGPCKTIAPLFSSLSNKLLHATFLKVDVDKQQKISQAHGVRAMPTFLFFKNGVKIDELKGADSASLTEKCNRHAGAAPKVYASASGSKKTDSLTSLKSLIDTRSIECLNEDPEHNIRSILGSDAKKDGYLESLDDEQLLITIPFLNTVKVSHLSLHSPAHKSSAATHYKLFINLPAPGFSDVESLPPVQEIELSAKQLEDGGLVELRFVKFQKVNSLHIFVVGNNEDEDTTKVEGLEIWGEAVEVTKNERLTKEDDN